MRCVIERNICPSHDEAGNHHHYHPPVPLDQVKRNRGKATIMNHPRKIHDRSHFSQTHLKHNDNNNLGSTDLGFTNKKEYKTLWFIVLWVLLLCQLRPSSLLVLFRDCFRLTLTFLATSKKRGSWCWEGRSNYENTVLSWFLHYHCDPSAAVTESGGRTRVHY